MNEDEDDEIIQNDLERSSSDDCDLMEVSQEFQNQEGNTINQQMMKNLNILKRGESKTIKDTQENRQKLQKQETTWQ